MSAIDRKNRTTRNVSSQKENGNKELVKNEKKEDNKKNIPNKGPGRPTSRNQLDKDQNNKLINEVFKVMETGTSKQMTDGGVNKAVEREWENMFHALKDEILEGIRSDFNASLKEIESKLESKMEELISRTEEMIIKSQKAIEQKVLEQYNLVELKFSEWDKEKKELLEKINKLEEIDRKRDQEHRRKNIIIRGLKTEKNDIRTEVEDFIEANLNLKIDLESAIKIKPANGEDFLKIRVKSTEDKKNIIEKKASLKGTQIYLDDDLTRDDREVQRKIYNIAKEERSRGNIAKIGYKKIYINNQLWVWKDEQGIVKQTRSFRQESDNHTDVNRIYTESGSRVYGNIRSSHLTVNREKHDWTRNNERKSHNSDNGVFTATREEISQHRRSK